MTRSTLTERQIHVLRLVARGCTNKEIAGRLGVCEQSVKEHVSRLLRRFGAANRAALAFCVAEMGIAAADDARAAHGGSPSDLVVEVEDPDRAEAGDRRPLDASNFQTMPVSAKSTVPRSAVPRAIGVSGAAGVGDGLGGTTGAVEGVDAGGETLVSASSRPLE